MPTVDEAVQDRATYGNAPGWSQSRRAVVPEGQPVPVANEEAPPASDEGAAPSAEEGHAPVESQVPEEATPSPVTPEATDVPFNKHPRWIERQQELERERAHAEELRQQNRVLMETMQRVAPQPQPVQAPDFWEGRTNHPDAATAQYWQGQKQMFELAVETGKQKAIAELQPVIQAGMSQLAQINTKAFRAENPEIKPGSEEERQVVAYMEGRMDGIRHPLESAKRNAMYDRLATENRALKTKQSSMPQKRSAAQADSSAGIPAGAGLPSKPGDWRERAGAALDAGGTFGDAVKAAFGSPRR